MKRVLQCVIALAAVCPAGPAMACAFSSGDPTFQIYMACMRGSASGCEQALRRPLMEQCRINAEYKLKQLKGPAAPVAAPRPAPSMAPTNPFANLDIPKCMTGDREACDRAESRTQDPSDLYAIRNARRGIDEAEAEKRQHAAQPAPVYRANVDPTHHPLVTPGQVRLVPFAFTCSANGSDVSITPSATSVYHQAIDFEPLRAYTACPGTGSSWGAIFDRRCQHLELSGYRVSCRGGVVSAPRLSVRNPEQYVKDLDPRLRSGGDEDSFEIPYDDGSQKYVLVLPAGWGPLPRSAAEQVISIPQERLFGPDYFAVAGGPPAPPEQNLYSLLSDYAPHPQAALLAVLAIAAGLAAFGFVHDMTPVLSPRHLWFWIFCAAAALGIWQTTGIGSAPRDAYAQAQRDMAEIAQDRAALKSMFQVTGGYLQPVRQEDLAAANRIFSKPHHITANPYAAGGQGPMLFFMLLPGLLFLIVYGLRILAGGHYLFVRHPAEAAVDVALETGSLSPIDSIAQALTPDPAHVDRPPPIYQSENLLARIRALRTKVEADGEFADALLERDRIRAALKAADEKVRNKKPKRQTTWAFLTRIWS